MTVRDQISRQIRRVGRLFSGGILLIGLLIPIGVLSEKLFGRGAVACVIGFAAALALLVAVFLMLGYSGRLVKCPCCDGNWSFALHGPYVRFFSLHSRYRFCPYCGTFLDSECPEEIVAVRREKAAVENSDEPVVREELARSLRWIHSGFLAGLAICGIAVLSQTLVAQQAADAVLYAGFAVAALALLYGYYTGLKCPCCGGNWSFLLHGRHYRLLSVHPRYQFCPYCGVSLDSRCSDDAAITGERS